MPNMDDMIPFNGLRGVCAMAIFLGHQTDMFLASPWSGQSVIIGLEYLQAISLFFLLSGLPLARLYSTTGKVHTWDGTVEFWRKRFARLAPMYYLTLALNLVVVLVTCEEVDVAAALESFFGCALFLQGWFVSMINVGGVLWQVAVFVFAYALFPFLSRRVARWTVPALLGGILALWLFSAALWCAVFAVSPPAAREYRWWVWHVHCVSRLPHFMAGVLLGELVERKRFDPAPAGVGPAGWAALTDALSLALLATAVQAPIVQAYRGTDARSDVSIGLQALLLPVHALWLAGMVLAHRPPPAVSCGSDLASRDAAPGDVPRECECWTRRVLSLKPLVALGDVSLALYCLHLVVMFFYTSALAYLTTGDGRIVPTIEDYALRVQSPWWHAPAQWALVLAASFAASRWLEAPLRRMLAGKRVANAPAATGTEMEAAALLPPGTNPSAYGGTNVAPRSGGAS